MYVCIYLHWCTQPVLLCDTHIWLMISDAISPSLDCNPPVVLVPKVFHNTGSISYTHTHTHWSQYTLSVTAQNIPWVISLGQIIHESCSYSKGETITEALPTHTAAHLMPRYGQAQASIEFQSIARLTIIMCSIHAMEYIRQAER